MGKGVNPSSIVTTSLKAAPDQVEKALETAQYLKAQFVRRDNDSIKKLLSRYGADSAVVVSNQQLICYHAGGQFFFHPDKSSLRIKELAAGKTDQMIKAMDLQQGNTIVDCTLGIATDAIVASYVTGDAGRVVGIEKSPLIAAIVKHGLQNYAAPDKKTTRAMRRIKVECHDHEQYLSELEPGSFDVVYFDPMFREPVNNAPTPVDGLRPLAEHTPVKETTIQEALRVARRRVVMKERQDSTEFKRLKADVVTGGKNSPVGYGIWFKEKVN